MKLNKENDSINSFASKNLQNEKKLLIFSAHPDDHLSCAGTALFLKDLGFEISEVVFTSGEKSVNNLSKENSLSADLKKIRSEEFKKASKILGTKNVYCLNQPDSNVSRSPELIDVLIKIIRKEKPLIAISENPNDYHFDHKQVGKIVVEALDRAGWGISSNLGKKHKTPVGLFMGSLIQNEKNDISVDVTEYWDKKLEILKVYGSQTSDMTFQLNEALGKYFGFYQRTKFAESFEIMQNFPIKLNILLEKILYGKM